MSTKVPVFQTSIPTPTDDPASIVQAVLAIKQTIENDHNIVAGKPPQPLSLAGMELRRAITAVTKTLA